MGTWWQNGKELWGELGVLGTGQAGTPLTWPRRLSDCSNSFLI